MTTEHVKAGDVLAGKFVVERVLGEGGMGVVVAARHMQLDQRVALKFLRPGTAGQVNLTERFAREARAVTRLKNEHVARVLDVGTMPDGAPYIVMEHLEGRDMAVTLRDRRRLPVPEAVDYVLQACEAIAEAHGAGIIHRDLKPANLFLTTGSDGLPLVKLLDFGISKVVRGAGGTKGSALTSTTELLGSPLYMSPEQLQSTRDVDVATDIWSLGVILYELLAGAPPFAAESMPQLCMQIMIMPHIALADRAAHVPEGLRAIIDRCLEKTPSRRFADVTELASALAAFTPDGARRSDSIRRIAGGRAEPPAVGAFSDTVAASMSWGQTLRGRPRRRAFVAVAVAAVGLLVGSTIFLARAPLAARRSVPPPAVAAAARTEEVVAPVPVPVAAPVAPPAAPVASAPSAPAPLPVVPRPKTRPVAAPSAAAGSGDLFSTPK